MATRYWVGGAGNWSSTSKWSTTSGGSSGASVPTSVDDAVFDANSGGKFTATVDTAQSINSITITPSSGAGVLQIALSARLTTNNLTTTGTAGNNRIWFRGATYGIAQDFSINGTVSISDCDFRDIYVIGTAAPISGTRIGDLRGIRGITASTPKTVYWVTAAGGNWSGNNWAASSGGAASTDNFPLAQDTATIENTGLNTSATVTLDSAVPYLGTIDMSGRTNAMTLAGSTGYTVYGNWVLGSGVTQGYSGTLTYSGRNTQTITSAGKTLSGSIIVNSYGGSVELADALNIGSNTLTVTNGTFDTKNYNVTAGVLSSSNNNVRTINLGSSTVTLSSSSGTTFATATNLTFNAGTSSIVFPTSPPSGIILNGGGLTFYDVSFTGTATATSAIIDGANTYRNLTFTAPASAGLPQYLLNANQTITGTLTCSGATAVRRIFLRSGTLGTTRTLTVGTLSATDCDFLDITIAGTAAGSSPTRAGDCGGNSGITFPSPKTVYWNLAGAQNWSATAWAPGSGGTPDINQFPLAQDTAVFDGTGSVTGTITINAAWNIGTFDASLRTSAMTLTTSNNAPFVYGDWKFGTGVTSSSTTGTITFAKRGTQTITSNGVSFGCPVTVDNFTGTVQLADALTLSAIRTLRLNSGIFDAVSYNVTVGLFANGSSVNNTLKMGSGTWTLSGFGAVWSIVSGTITFYKNTADIVLSDTSTNARTFAGGSLSYNKLTIGGTTGTSTLTIDGNNQFTELASTKTVAHTIDLGATTQTFGKWSVTGTSGNVVTLTGTGTGHILAGAATSGIDYLAMGSIGFSATSPGEFYAGANSTGTAAAPVYRTAKPADSTRYWVGGTGNWSDTARWSTSSGGASGASVPRSHDDVVFDSASNATAYTATVNAVTGGIRCKALTIAGPASGNVTLAGSTAIVGIHGSVTLPATGLTRTYTGAITLSGSTSGLTLTTNGVALASAITVNGVSSGWTLGSALDAGSTSFTVTNGSFDYATYNLTASQIASDNQNSRTINFGSGTFTLSGSSPVSFGSTETARAGLSFSSGTSQLNFSSANPSPFGNNQTFYNVSFTSTFAGTVTINGANSFNNLSFTGITSAGLKLVSVTANQTITGTFTCSAGTNATMRTFVQSNTIGITRTLTCAAVSLTDADFRDITIAGAAAPVSGTRLGDCKGNSGITFTAAANKYWNLAAGGNWGGAIGWATSSGGSPAINNFPLAQDTCYFEATGLNSGATITINQSYNIGTIDMSARTSNTMTLATGSTTPTIYGNWINGTGTTLTGSGVVTLAGRGSQTVTSAGKTFTQPFTVNSPGGSVTLQDAYTMSLTSSALNITAGTFDANGYSVTLSGSSSAVSSSNSNTRTIAIGSGAWTIAGSGTAWQTSTATNLTVTGTGTISLTSASAKTFAGGDVAYTNITLDQGGAGTLTITGNNTFKDITNTYKSTGATNITLGTTTQRVSQFTAAGESGRVLTIQGSSASSPSTLILTGGTDPNVDYLAITGVRAYSLDTTWYAGANSTNNGSLGWYFESGAVVITASVSESSRASDSLTSLATLNITLTETANASDTVASTGVFGSALSESATAADITDAIKVYLASVAESATSADVVNAANSLAAAISELATAAETVDTRVQITSQVLESASAADSATRTVVFIAAVLESATAQEIAAATLSFNRAVSESARASDTTTVAASTFNAAASDTARALDAPSAVVVFPTSVAESAAGSDSSSAAAVFFARVGLFAQYMKDVATGTSASGAVMFDSAAFVQQTSIAANGTGSGTGGFSSGGNYLAFYGGSSTLSYFSVTPISLANSATLKVTYISGNGSNGGATPTSPFGSTLDLIFRDPAGVTLGTVSLPQSSTYTTATIPITPTLQQTELILFRGFTGGSAVPYWGITEILIYGEGDLLAASDTTASSAIFAALNAETARATDTALVVASTFNAAAFDTAQAADSQNAPGSIYNVTLPESAAATDTILGAFLWNLIDDDQNPNWVVISTPQNPGWSVIDDSQDPNWQNISNI